MIPIAQNQTPHYSISTNENLSPRGNRSYYFKSNLYSNHLILLTFYYDSRDGLVIAIVSRVKTSCQFLKKKAFEV